VLTNPHLGESTLHFSSAACVGRKHDESVKRKFGIMKYENERHGIYRP
jgi:hypothetical protein